MDERRTAWAAGLAVAGCVALLGCKPKGTPSDELMQRARKTWANEVKLAQAFPAPDALREKACPPGITPRRVSWTELCGDESFCKANRVIQSGTDPFESLDTRLYRTEKRFTNNPEPRKLAQLEAALAHVDAHQHVQVARITELDHGRRLGPETFKPGSATVWVVTLDRDSHEVVCATSFSVQNERYVSYELGKDSARAIERQVEEKVRAALGKMVN